MVPSTIQVANSSRDRPSTLAVVTALAPNDVVDHSSTLAVTIIGAQPLTQARPTVKRPEQIIHPA